jgi:hypothetical protein
MMIHAWSGEYDYPIWRIYPKTKTIAEDAVVPVCQSPKILNVIVQAKGVPANDNCPLAETSEKSFQARGFFAVVWLTFLGFFLGRPAAARFKDGCSEEWPTF